MLCKITSESNVHYINMRLAFVIVSNWSISAAQYNVASVFFFNQTHDHRELEIILQLFEYWRDLILGNTTNENIKNNNYQFSITSWYFSPIVSYEEGHGQKEDQRYERLLLMP